MKDTALGVMPFLASDFIRIVVLVFFPVICLGLVNHFG
jgi:TRAP-type C4-dicarboxylate transport system permease large subunit